MAKKKEGDADTGEEAQAPLAPDRSQPAPEHGEPGTIVLSAPEERGDEPPKAKKAAKEKKDEGPARYDAQGRLTHHGMCEAVKAGGCVLWNGEHVTRLEDLPAEEEVVQGNEEAERALADSLDDQLAALSARRARLGGGKAKGRDKDKE